MDDQQDQKTEHIFDEHEKGKTCLKQTFSPSSSPTHEFSFIISLHQSKPSPSIPSTDLSPADDIFFHGHLLPLHFLSHPPRSSTNSLDINIGEKTSKNSSTSEDIQTQGKVKSKPLSFFGRQSRRRKGSTEEKEKEDRAKKRRKLSFNMGNLIRRYYIKVIKPLFFLRGKKENNMEMRRKAVSFSGYFNPSKVREVREKGGVVSAPVSRWTSPRNSGPLVGNELSCATKSDSTMEEVQAAIQAAIAHCKNSISSDEII